MDFVMMEVIFIMGFEQQFTALTYDPACLRWVENFSSFYFLFLPLEKGRLQKSEAGTKGQCPLFYDWHPRWHRQQQIPVFCTLLCREAQTGLMASHLSFENDKMSPCFTTRYLFMPTPKS
ncbi:hypothetical protein SAMN04488121_102382 [Chitinophaga filiformis]|uniref:Uncharacterized protein n=1 Tax=Chitinophaga filiformis TaxID=104663 RepID=A0A1G7MDC8_CHIFI|nr:hypothetical protein SAMN04488121_102382 [Chitinophaga filiformis]